MAFFAACIAAGAAIYATRKTSKSHADDLTQRDAHHQESLATTTHRNDASDRTDSIGRCWDRLVWLVEASGSSPSSGGSAFLSIDMAEEIGAQLEKDARELKDETLQIAVLAYVTNLGLLLVRS